MQIISGTTDFLLQGASAVAIGKFDGMHRGHKALLSEILEAKKRGLQAVVFTFDPPPAVLFSGKAVKGLTTREEKRRLFRQIGIDVLIEFPLTFQTAAISPEDFLRVIVQEQIRAKLVAAGTDLSFGDRGLGDCKLLKARAEAYGYEVKIIDTRICKFRCGNLGSALRRSKTELRGKNRLFCLFGNLSAENGVERK